MKKLGFGCMRLPQANPSDYGNIDLKTMENMVDAFLTNGFTYFDTAYMYHMGNSETALKRCLVNRHNRDSYTVATKLPVMMLKSVQDQERIFSEQLQKCGVEYFDYYLLHNLTIDFVKTAERLDSFGFINKKKKEGLIKKTGFSFHDNAFLLDEILTAHPEVDFVQLQINYLDWDNEAIQSRKCYNVARKHGKPVVVMEPVKGGTLARLSQEAESLLLNTQPGMSVASWAIRFAGHIS